MTISFEEIKHKKLDDLIKRENEYEFPEFLTMLRQILGANRKILAKELDISDFLLFRWENGKFKRCIKPLKLAIISDYYHVPFKLMSRKMKEFIVGK